MKVLLKVCRAISEKASTAYLPPLCSPSPMTHIANQSWLFFPLSTDVTLDSFSSRGEPVGPSQLDSLIRDSS